MNKKIVVYLVYLILSVLVLLFMNQISETLRLLYTIVDTTDAEGNIVRIVRNIIIFDFSGVT